MSGVLLGLVVIVACLVVGAILGALAGCTIERVLVMNEVHNYPTSRPTP